MLSLRKHTFFILIFGIFLSISVTAQEVPSTTRLLEISQEDPAFQSGQYDLKDYLSLLQDASNKWNPNTIINTSEWESLSEENLQLLQKNQSDQHTIWLKLTVLSKLPHKLDWLCNISAAEVEMYTIEDKKLSAGIKSGSALPVSQRYLGNTFGTTPYLPFVVKANEQQTFYWKIKPHDHQHFKPLNDLNIKLVSHEYAINYHTTLLFLIALIIGILLTASLYQGAIYFFVKDKAFLFFSLTALCLAFGVIWRSSLALQFLWPEQPIWNNDYFYYIYLFCVLGGNYLFIRYFLNLPHYSISLDKTLRLGLLFTGLFCLSRLLGNLFQTPFLLSMAPIYDKVLLFAMAFFNLLLLISGIVVQRKGYRPASYYIFAFIVPFLTSIYLTLFHSSGIPNAYLDVRSIAIAIGALLFSLALAERFRRIHENKLEAERKIILEQKRNSELDFKRKLEEAEAIRLKELDAIKTKFYTNITHEFRTPITIISGMADQIKENPEQWLAKGTKMIKRNSNLVLNLVNQLLDLRKLESGTLSLNMVQSDIVAYLQYILESFHSYAGKKSIHLHFLSEMESCYLDYDPDKLLKIISNLLSNAIKFTPDEGNVYLQVAEIKKEESALLQIKVRDTGIGIPEDQLAYVFDRFYQVDQSTTRQGEGTGVGLALTYELSQLLNGEITVNSKEGKGTEFTFTFPISHNAKRESAQPSIMEAIASPAIQSPETTPGIENKDLPQLLVIEDNPDVAQYLVSCLEGQYQMELAANGQIGYEKALELVPDIIICDYMMPIMDGLEVCEKLKADERTSHIPFIMLTAKATIEDKISGLERGADAYLTKPFNKEELLIRIKKLIELRTLLQQKYSGFDFKAQPAKELSLEEIFLEKVQKIIFDNLDDEDFSIVHLCRAIGMSRSQVHNKLKALTGRSTSIYIRGLRLQQAQQLLRSTKLSISEIAYEVGFKDPNYFSRCFTEEFGTSPSDFRT